jgi:hypothetical protein
MHSYIFFSPHNDKNHLNCFTIWICLFLFLTKKITTVSIQYHHWFIHKKISAFFNALYMNFDFIPASSLLNISETIVFIFNSHYWFNDSRNVYRKTFVKYLFETILWRISSIFMFYNAFIRRKNLIIVIIIFLISHYVTLTVVPKRFV